MIKRFQRSFHFQPDLDIIFGKSTAEIHPLHTIPQGLGFHAKPVFFSNIFIGNLYLDALIIELCQIFQVRISEKVHFKRFLLVYQKDWHLFCGTGDRRKLCMVPCHIYGTPTSKELEGTF